MTTVKEHYHHHSLTDGLFLGLKCILSHKQGPWESDKDFGPEQKANKDKFHHSSSTAAPEPEKEDLLKIFFTIFSVSGFLSIKKKQNF